MRAAIQHNLLYDAPQRLWYMGPMFRHERPQKGRYRQFHQVGVEALGYAGPDIDAERIADVRAAVGLTSASRTSNCSSIRSAVRRSGRSHRTGLVRICRRTQDALDADAKRRLHTNPLRVLDSKNPCDAGR